MTPIFHLHHRRQSTSAPPRTVDPTSAGQAAPHPPQKSAARPAPTLTVVTALDCELALVRDEPCDAPTVMDLRRAQLREPSRAGLYQFAVNARVHRAQAEARAEAREHGPDLDPAA